MPFPDNDDNQPTYFLSGQSVVKTESFHKKKKNLAISDEISKNYSHMPLLLHGNNHGCKNVDNMK